MKSTLAHLIHEIETRKIFKRNKKDIKLKILAALLYFLWLSLRKMANSYPFSKK